MQLEDRLRTFWLEALPLEVGGPQAIRLHRRQITCPSTIVHGGKLLRTQLTHPGFAAGEHGAKPRALFLWVDDDLVWVLQRHSLLCQHAPNFQRTHHPHNAIEPSGRRDGIDMGTGHHCRPRSGERIEAPQHDAWWDLDHLKPNRHHLCSQIRACSPILVGKC